MNKSAQKAAAAIIGLILSGLLIYIGFRIVEKRSSGAAAPESFICKRAKDTEALCTWTSKTEEVGRVLYASMPAGGIQECNLVFIAEEVGTPVAMGDGNFEHSVTLQPLVANQAYCAAPGGNEESIVEVGAAAEGAASQQSANQGQKGVVLDVTPSLTPQPSQNAVEPTSASVEPTQGPEPTGLYTSDTSIDTFYKDNPDDDWGDCLKHFDSKGEQISSNACIKGYYRYHAATPTPTP